jgi:hypothetical protein
MIGPQPQVRLSYLIGHFLSIKGAPIHGLDRVKKCPQTLAPGMDARGTA